MKTALHWFRNDLRVADNTSLTNACKADRVLAVYCFDPRFFTPDPYGFPRTGTFRARFLQQTVAALRLDLEALNIPLLLFYDRPEACIPEVATRFAVDEIHFQREWTRDERAVDQALLKALPQGVRVFRQYDQFLFHPQDIPFGDVAGIPEVFTNFRKACEKTGRIRKVLPVPSKRPVDHWLEPEGDMPELEKLGLEAVAPDPRTAFPFQGGSRAGMERLNAYFWAENRLRVYKKTRNGLLGAEYSSKFSPWLANGSLSARQIYHEVRRYEAEIVRNQDTYWMVFELIWRDYFKYISLKHQDRIFYPGGIRDARHYPEVSPTLLTRWTTGTTGNDFIDANMRELALTGWMSNRGRQNAASYWTHHLRQDWRAGASYFESLLLDYDVHSNWGNWMYNSGVGNDPRDRVFNPGLQAQRYDPQGRYRRLWLQPTLF